MRAIDRQWLIETLLMGLIWGLMLAGYRYCGYTEGKATCSESRPEDSEK